MTIEEVIEYLKSLVEVRRKYGDMQTMKDEIECLEMGVKELTAISELSKSLKAVNRYDMDEKVLIGFNMAVAIFNECFGEICALKNEQPEQNVGMCQQNVGKMSEKQTGGDLISKEAVIEWLKDKDIIKTKNQEENARRELAVLPSVTQPSAENTAIKININENVKVKLTDYGKEIFYHQYDNLNKTYGKEIIKPRFPKVDSDGYTSFQLWCFMNLYGRYIDMGMQNVIEPLEIVFESAEKTDTVLEDIKAEIKEWYFQADKQALAKDPCVIDAMIDLFIRTINKYKAESEEE